MRVGEKPVLWDMQANRCPRTDLCQAKCNAVRVKEKTPKVAMKILKILMSTKIPLKMLPRRI